MVARQDAEPRVKGIAFRSIEACCAEMRGEDARNAARELMKPDLRELYKNGLVLASSWYPISWYRDAFHAFRTLTREGSDLVRQIGYLCILRDMSSVHK